MKKQYYQIMSKQTGLTLAMIMAGSMLQALTELAKQKGYDTWEAYRDCVGIIKVDFDGFQRVYLT